MKKLMKGLVNRFFPAPYVHGGRPARCKDQPKTTESMFDECVGVTTSVPRSAQLRIWSSGPSMTSLPERSPSADNPWAMLPGERRPEINDGKSLVAKVKTRGLKLPHTSRV